MISARGILLPNSTDACDVSFYTFHAEECMLFPTLTANNYPPLYLEELNVTGTYSFAFHDI